LRLWKEDFHEVALSIELPVEREGSLALGLRVDDGFEVACANFSPEIVRVVARITDESSAAGVVEQLLGDDHLVPLDRGSA
jgi:hypothetical protein